MPYASLIRTILYAILTTLVACTSEYHSGVISTGNAGRVVVRFASSDQDSSKTGELKIIRKTDSIPEVVGSCTVRLDSECSDTLLPGSYRAEAWIDGRISGKTGWFLVEGDSTRSIVVDLVTPRTVSLSISTTANVDSVVLGSRSNAATLIEGAWQITILPDSSDAIWIKIQSGGTWTWIRYQLTSNGSNVTVSPVSPGAPALFVESDLTLTPSNTEWAETAVIGAFSGTSSWSETNFGYRANEGLGGAYDGKTIGRLLVRISLPDSLSRYTILSAKLVYTPLTWGIRPTGGRDLTIAGHRVLRPWKEGTGSGQNGAAVSESNDGAAALFRSFGASWNKPLVGLDGVDALAEVSTTSTLAYNSLDTLAFDVSESIRSWIANPETNFGFVFRSIHENDGLFLDYPDFASDDHPDLQKRPRLILKLGR